MYYLNGDRFGGIAINLTNKNHLFIGGYPLLESGDGGKTWRSKQPLSLQNSYEQLYLQQGTLFCTTPNGLQLSYDNGRSFATKNVSQAIAFSQLCYDQASRTIVIGILSKELYIRFHLATTAMPPNLMANSSLFSPIETNFSLSEVLTMARIKPLCALVKKHHCLYLLKIKISSTSGATSYISQWTKVAIGALFPTM